MVKIEVDKEKLKRFLECHVEEQDWGDYAAECELLASDILSRNPELKEREIQAY